MQTDEKPYRQKIDFQYSGFWIEVTVRESHGLFLGDARVTPHSPTAADRFWTGLNVGEQAAFAGPEAAFEEWTHRAKAWIDDHLRRMADVGEGWKLHCQSACEGWIYAIHVQQRGDRFFSRVAPENQRFKFVDGDFASKDEAVTAAHALAESAIREIRSKEGY